MYIAKKANREYSISARDKSKYADMGYQIIEVDDKGRVKPTPEPETPKAPKAPETPAK
ncbi:MAG: hypothetical protein LBJ91_02605 [Clostridiales Family XIII bacterium]|jgi:hypothetical protein|nr:hypothetical protein [Clostridiales Family XIII bacterium]